MDARLLLAIVLGAYAVERSLEGIINLRHEKRVRQRGAVAVRPDGFYGIAFAQAATFLVIIVEGYLWPGRQPIVWLGTYPLLALAAFGLVLRHWSIATLGDRWTFRVWILPQEPLVVKGPYRFLRHPNYLAVLIEYVTVPLALGLWITAAIGIPLGGLTLLYRKRIEERALTPQRNVKPEPVPRQTT